MSRLWLVRRARFWAAAIAVSCGVGEASAAVLYSANFNAAGDSAGWSVNKAGATAASPNNVPVAADRQGAAFGWDYSTLGIPAAPGNAPTDTFGLRLRANVSGGDATPNANRQPGSISGLSVSPTGQNFGASYKLTFYAWANYFGESSTGAAPNGLGDSFNSSGGTFNVLAAVGTSGSAAMVAGAATSVAVGASMDGVGFATINDRGDPGNYVRVYAASNTATTAGTNPAVVYAAGNTGAAQQIGNTYYTSMPGFGGQAAPGVQQSIATAESAANAAGVMAGTTEAGAFGFAWRKVEIEKLANSITWTVDGKLWATVDASALSLGGNNIALGTSDVNASSARFPSLAFTVFDNLVVESIPEPSTAVLAAVSMGMMGLCSRRRRCA